MRNHKRETNNTLVPKMDKVTYPLTPWLETREQDKKFLEKINKTDPAARIAKLVIFFTRPDDESRIQLLKDIQGTKKQSQTKIEQKIVKSRSEA